MLTPWKKSYDKARWCTKKQRHHFADKGPYSQNYGAPNSHVWMWKLDHQQSWMPMNLCFWTVVLERTLFRVLWTSRRSNQLTLKEVSLEYSLEGLMLMKLQYFGHLKWRADSLGKTLMLGKIEGRRRSRWQRMRMRWLEGITDSMDMSFSKFQKTEKDKEAWSASFMGSESDMT